MQSTLPGYGLITAILHALRACYRPREGRHQPGLRRQREPRLSARRIPATSSLDARRSGRRSRPRCPAHAQPPPAAAALQARAEGTPEIPATLPPPRPPSQGNPRSPCSRTRLLLAPARPGSRQEGGNAPPRGGAGPWNRPPFPPRHAGPGHALTPSGNRLSCICGTRTPQHLRKPETPKVGGVATKWGFKSRHGALADIILGCPRVRSACRFG